MILQKTDCRVCFEPRIATLCSPRWLHQRKYHEVFLSKPVGTCGSQSSLMRVSESKHWRLKSKQQLSPWKGHFSFESWLKVFSKDTSVGQRRHPSQPVRARILLPFSVLRLSDSPPRQESQAPPTPVGSGCRWPAGNRGDGHTNSANVFWKGLHAD